MNITFYGQSCFLIESAEHRIIIDPYLTGNPLAPLGPDDLEVTAILVTHGHGDHLGDGIYLSNKDNALLVAPFELAKYCETRGAFTHPMHIGGAHRFPFGRLQLTQALHGSGIQEGDGFIYAGNPCGYVLETEGRVLYHSGDTGLFGDMRLIGEIYDLDLAMIPIGDNFVMGIDDAVRAAGMLKAKNVVPMHYNTREIMRQDPVEFQNKVGKQANVIILNPGESTQL